LVLFIVRVTVKKKIAYGFQNALNYSRDDFHEDRHDTTIRLLARHALFIPMRVPHLDPQRDSLG
jgi:hypothetical protein